MEKRKLGRSGIEISPIGIGCWAMGGLGWGGETVDRDSIRAIHKALDFGINFYDTADIYGNGRSERVLGEALQGRRDKAIIATKFAHTWIGQDWDHQGKDPVPNASPEYIRFACEDSLKRLKTDYIDLYQFHWNEFGPEGAEQVRDTLEELVSEGKIRAYGWSTDYPDRAKIFAEGKNCTSIQAEMNVVNPADEIVQICEEFDLATICRGPLAMGLLTGKYKAGHKLPTDDVRGPNAPDWMKYFKNGQPNAEWLDKVNAVREILQSEGRSLAQGAIAWLWARTEKSIPIPGFRSLEQVEENLASLKYGPLTTAQMEQIESILRTDNNIDVKQA